MGFMPLTTTLVVTWIGLAAIPRFEGLDAVEADRVMPLLLGDWAAAGRVQTLLAIGVFLGALAAIMSTADSVLLSLGSLVAEDLLGHSRRDPGTTRLGTRVAAALMAVTACLAIAARDVTLWGLIEVKLELLIQCAPAFLIAIHWPGFRALPGAAGAVAGSAIALAGALSGTNRLGGVHVGLLGLAVNVAIAALASWWLGRRARYAPKLARLQSEGRALRGWRR
jgi:Na+/proline symporter